MTTARYAVRVSAYDDCDVCRTYESVWELERVPETRADAWRAADELVAKLAADGYTDVVCIRIYTYPTTEAR